MKRQQSKQAKNEPCKPRRPSQGLQQQDTNGADYPRINFKRASFNKGVFNGDDGIDCRILTGSIQARSNYILNKNNINNE